LSGAFGSFIGAVVAGKNGIQFVNHVFTDSAKPPSPYVAQIYQNERDIRENADDAFVRRQEAIQKAQEEKVKADEKAKGSNRSY
jgi:hypothetical protein